MSGQDDRRKTITLSLKHGGHVSRVAELIFLSQESALINTLWKVAAMPKQAQRRLTSYLERIDDPSQLVAVERAPGQLCLQLSSGSPPRPRRSSRRTSRKVR